MARAQGCTYGVRWAIGQSRQQADMAWHGRGQVDILRSAPASANDGPGPLLHAAGPWQGGATHQRSVGPEDMMTAMAEV